MKLHPFYRVVASVFFEPSKGKSGHSKPVVEPTSDGIDYDEPIAISAACGIAGRHL